MANETEILHPREVEDSPFPGESIPVPSESIGGQQVFTPTETPDQPFPKRVIASELISASLDTMSNKILGEYKFTSMGAIKIGQIKISDDGILGEDVDGRTTFALDPDDGSATFRGRILAGSVIATEIQGEYIVAGTITADKLSASYIQVTGAAADVNAGSTTISGGKITAQTITSLGAVTAGSFAIGSNAWHVDASGNMWWGSSSTYAGATIRISTAGSVDFTTGNFSGAITGGTIDIGGADTSSFHVDATGVFWMGAAAYASAPFRSTNAGVVDIVELHLGNNGGTNYFASDSSLNMTADIILSGGSSLTWNGGDISGTMPSHTSGAINMNGSSITSVNQISGDSGNIDFNEAGRIQISTHLDPGDGGSYNLGGSTRYWGDVSYKTLTDRGCLGWFDDGVELQDGKIVSDTEALLNIKKHSTKLTIYGKPMLDYTSLPKVVYKAAADNDGKLYERDQETNEPLPIKEKIIVGKVGKKVFKKEVIYHPQDGAETTALLSIMIGAIKELTNRVLILEQR